MSENEAVTEVTKEEFLNMARRASDEIKQLRAEIAFLLPKAQAYDALQMVLGMIPRQRQGAGEDLAALLDRRVEFISKVPAVVISPETSEG